MSYNSDDDEEPYNSYDDDGSEDYFSSVDDDEDTDESCQSDGECGDVVSDDDDDEPNNKAERNDKGYVFETLADVRKRQDEVTANVSELLSIPWGLAAVFLRHCRWDPERLENEWFADERRVREAVGLAADHQGDAATAVVNDRALTCAICFDVHGPGEMVSAGCAHFYCRECWGGYIHAAVGDGARCLTLRCPDPGCGAPVVRELVRVVAAAGEDGDRARYETFVVRSYVEEGTSKYVRWCPGPGCTLAVRSSEPRSALYLYEVACECRHVFCFRCGEEAHRPASCGATREWMAKDSADGETAQWVLANTKHCPRCRRPIEKNLGCNHMTCGAPCGHHFCWVCLGPWAEHGGSYYHCNRYEAHREPEPSKEERRREHARASLDRYMFFYERWMAHGASMRTARRDLERLEGGALAGFAEANGVTQAELASLEEAYALIIESRRVLRWTYPLVYYMDPERDEAKIELCVHIQSEAEESLEKLHGCVEREWNELMGEAAAPGAEYEAASAAVFAAAFKKYMLKLFVLNRATRNHLKVLVEGFESGMPEFKVTLDD